MPTIFLFFSLAVITHFLSKSSCRRRERRLQMTSSKKIHTSASRFIVNPQVRIGHIHLKVANLERALSFYCSLLGFELTQRFGDGAAFLSAGGYHHHIAINTWESLGGSPPPPGTTGLYHTAILYPSRAALAETVRRLLAAKTPLDGAADHGVSESIYLHDPDQNGVELYCDKPKELWPQAADGRLAMYTGPLDLSDLLRETTSDLHLAQGPQDL